MPIWLLKVGGWLRRNWWVPVVFVVLLAVFLLGGFAFRRKDGARAVDPLRDVRRLKRENDAKLDARAAEAEMERDRRIAEIEQEHAETLAKLDADQKKRAERYRRNPDRLARWLNTLTEE